MTTKEKIREAAFNLISESGYAATSIRTIASKVGIRESAIYNHFGSKEELFKTVLDFYRNESRGTSLLSEDLLEELNKPKKFLHKFSEKLINHWAGENERKLLRIILKEQFNTYKSFSLSIDDFIEESEKVWLMIFTQMIKFGFIKKAVPAVLANEFIAPLFFIRIKHLSGGETGNIKNALKEVDEHIDFFWNAIKK